MDEQGKGFTVIEVSEWNMVRSRVLGASQKPMRDTPRAVKVKCNECGTTFVATESNSGNPGTFLPTIGHMLITCRKCENEDTVKNPEP